MLEILQYKITKTKKLSVVNCPKCKTFLELRRLTSHLISCLSSTIRDSQDSYITSTDEITE